MEIYDHKCIEKEKDEMNNNNIFEARYRFQFPLNFFSSSSTFCGFWPIESWSSCSHIAEHAGLRLVFDGLRLALVTALQIGNPDLRAKKWTLFKMKYL